LNDRPHRSIDDGDAFAQDFFERMKDVHYPSN
jgi:hypothetical protein